MTQMPKVTVYVTNHNYGRYIEQAIDSVLRQSMQDFELIVIDDGSSDNSREIIERYVGHPKVVPIFQSNKGLNVTNNIAIRAARGRYVMRLDADDWLDENALQLLSNALDRDEAVGLVFPDYYNVDVAGHIMELVRRHDFDNVTLFDQPAHGACTMIRRQCLLDLGGYDESLRCQDGYDLWIRFISHHKVANINLPLFYYRQHGASLTRNERRILDTRSRIIERHAQLKGTIPNSLAILAVRGPSLDPSSPALEMLGGKRVIDWTLEAALNSRHISGVVVTSPDSSILDHAQARYGDKILAVARDNRLALRNTRIEDTLIAAMDEWQRRHQQEIQLVVSLAVELPFRQATHIDTALEVMMLFECDTVIAIRPENDLFYTHDGTGLKPLRRTTSLRLEREEIYREVGGLRVVQAEKLRQTKDMFGSRVGHVVLDQRAAQKLGSDLDWKICRTVADEFGSGC